MKRTTALGTTLIAFFASIAQAQITYWDPASGGNGHYYQPIAPVGGITWDNAKLAAEAQGGYLATLTSAAENSFVFSLIDAPSFWQGTYYGDSDTTHNSGPLFGGFQPSGSTEPDGGWQWFNGDGTFSATFANWTAGQPNNYFGGQSVTRFWISVPGNTTPPRTSQWDDFESFITAPSYVIEYNTAPVPEPAAGAVVAGAGMILGAAWLRWRGPQRLTT